MGGKSQTVRQKAEPWKPAQPFLQGALGDAQSLYRSGGFSADPFGGNRVAGFSPETMQAQQGIMGQAAGGVPGVSAARDTLTAMLGGQGGFPGMDAVRQNVLGGAIPAATAMFSGSGMANSSVAQEGVGRAAAEALAPFEYGAWNAAQDRAVSAASMMPGMEAAMYMPFDRMAGVGAQQDAMSQQRINADMQRWYEQEGQQAQNYQGYLNAIMGLGGMGGQQTSQQPMPGTGLGPAVMGGLGAFGTLAGIPALAGTSMPAIGGILAGLAGLSDRRAKEDVRRVGWLDNGVAVYRFRYRGHPGYMLGVMADEVPWAVRGEWGGYALVDYGEVV